MGACHTRLRRLLCTAQAIARLKHTIEEVLTSAETLLGKFGSADEEAHSQDQNFMASHRVHTAKHR